MSILISIEKLLSGKFVEDSRMEFKKGWNPVSTLRTICAFANDFGNDDSGYIIIGVEEVGGRAKRPVIGFNPDDYNRSFFVIEFSIFPDFSDNKGGGQIGGQIQLTNRQNEIIKLIKKNNKISRNMISSILGINESAVQKHLNTLKEKGILKRVGGTRGYWKIIKLGKL